MHSFDAYFNGNQVCINKKRQYTSNEALTQLLNMDFGALPELRKRLVRYQYRLRMEFDMNLSDMEKYDGWAHRAQSLMHQVDAVAQSINLYSENLEGDRLARDRLFDALNSGSVFFSRTHDDEQNYYEDNDYGLYLHNGEHHCFYLTTFVPDIPDAPFGEHMALEMEAFNRTHADTFERYIAFIDDLLQVQSVYADFLENHLSSQSKYLNEHELAQAYSAFVSKQDAAFKSSRIDMGHAVLQDAEGREVLCESYHFERLSAFLYIDLFKGIAHHCIPKRCHNCGRWFLLRGGKYADYCNEPIADGSGKTCRDIGSRKRYGEKCKTDPVWQIYNRAYKQHYARYMKKQMTVAQFERWSA